MCRKIQSIISFTFWCIIVAPLKLKKCNKQDAFKLGVNKTIKKYFYNIFSE